jgi:UDP-N-acetylmuramate dehydrogenase
MKVLQNISLKPFNSFSIDVNAQYFGQIRSKDELREINGPVPIFILGGGSNVLFTKDVEGLVLLNEIKGIEVIKETKDYVLVRAGGGEVWHDFVEYCIDHGYAGIENLALIPGSVGAAPIQNIGAYGVEVKEVIEQVEGWDIQEKSFRIFQNEECGFGYRDSVFKRNYKGKYLITTVTFRLTKQPIFKTSYGAIQDELNRMGVQLMSIRAIADAVIHIRQSKLPDPKKIGNAGSFFKNPEVSMETFEALKMSYPSIVGYPIGSERIKIAAGWLIEQAGWKGYRKGNYGVHHQQALVLVNYGGATGNEIYQLSEEILASVKTKFNILLEREVNVL